MILASVFSLGQWSFLHLLPGHCCLPGKGREKKASVTSCLGVRSNRTFIFLSLGQHYFLTLGSCVRKSSSIEPSSPCLSLDVMLNQPACTMFPDVPGRNVFAKITYLVFPLCFRYSRTSPSPTGQRFKFLLWES